MIQISSQSGVLPFASLAESAGSPTGLTMTTWARLIGAHGTEGEFAGMLLAVGGNHAA